MASWIGRCAKTERALPFPLECILFNKKIGNRKLIWCHMMLESFGSQRRKPTESIESVKGTWASRYAIVIWKKKLKKDRELIYPSCQVLHFESSCRCLPNKKSLCNGQVHTTSISMDTIILCLEGYTTFNSSTSCETFMLFIDILLGDFDNELE